MDAKMKISKIYRGETTPAIIHCHTSHMPTMLVRPLLYSSLIANSRRSIIPSTVAAMSMSSTTDQQCSGKSALIFLHGVSRSPSIFIDTIEDMIVNGMSKLAFILFLTNSLLFDSFSLHQAW